MQNKNRKKYIFIGILLALIGIILNYTYRIYVYKNNIYDFHFADTIGSILCVPSSSFFFYGIYRKYKFKELIFKSTIAFIIYEFFTIAPVHGTFDYFDLIAILIGASITYFIYLICRYKSSQNNY